MQKIMFNDKYGLTKAVLEGRKTQTRRIALHFAKDVAVLDELNLQPEDRNIVQYVIDKYSRFKVGEVVAVAQPLKDLGYDARDTSGGHIWGLDHEPAWTNKMFVCASQCKNHIRITGIRLERLQDISDEDCLKEGIRKWEDEKEYLTDKTVRKSVDELKAAGYDAYAIPGCWDCYTSPREAYAALIDKISGKGTWDKNPWVFVFNFTLEK